jgi:hypothetical protein
MANIESIPLHSYTEWRFGIVTRSVYRARKNLFLIDDTSDGWYTARVTLNQMINLTEGNLSLLSLEWK